jgi:hypothetical protein
MLSGKKALFRLSSSNCFEENTEKNLGHALREINQPPTKWQVYERILRIPYYIVFARDPDKFRAFQLTRGHYRELTLPDKRLWLGRNLSKI